MGNELRNLNNNVFGKCHTGMFVHLENLKPVLIFQQVYEPISLMDGGVSAIEGYEKQLFHVALSPYSKVTTTLIVVKSLFQDSSKSTTLGFKAIVQV